MTIDQVLALVIVHRAAAVRLAQSIVGMADAEDCVSEVGAYLLERRAFLRQVPGPAYFFTAVKHAALRVRQRGWWRFMVPMDPEDLLIAEQVHARGGRVMPRDGGE